MSLPLVLDAAGLDELAQPQPSAQLRALLREAWVRDRDVLVPALVCAEVCRGPARTRAVEAALQRHVARLGQRPAVRVVDTDFALARQVGAVLSGAQAATDDLVDTHVVAVCVGYGGGLVVTSDPDDVRRLSEAVPAVRIVTRASR